MRPKTLYTIGYSRKSIEEFIPLLEKNHVTLLLDVRDSGKSLHRPEFRSSALAASLEAYGIDYCHIPESGVLYAVRQPYIQGKISNDEFRKWYHRNIEESHRSEFLEAVRLVAAEDACLMCLEASAVPAGDQKIYCHRYFLAEEILAFRDVNGLPVVEKVVHL